MDKALVQQTQDRRRCALEGIARDYRTALGDEHRIPGCLRDGPGDEDKSVALSELSKAFDGQIVSSVIFIAFASFFFSWFTRSSSWAPLTL